MSLSDIMRVSAILAFTTGCASARIEDCPPSLAGEPLTDVGLYDGPVSEMAELIPADGGWDIDYRPVSKKGFYLACHYQGKILEIHLPDTVKRCRFQGYPHVVCR